MVQPGICPSGFFAEHCKNRMLKGSKSKDIIAANVSACTLLQDGGSIDQAPQWANEQCQAIKIQWSSDPPSIGLAFLYVAVLLRSYNVITMLVVQEWLVTPPADKLEHQWKLMGTTMHKWATLVLQPGSIARWNGGFVALEMVMLMSNLCDKKPSHSSQTQYAWVSSVLQLAFLFFWGVSVLNLPETLGGRW
jgi:hypothetical protein